MLEALGSLGSVRAADTLLGAIVTRGTFGAVHLANCAGSSVSPYRSPRLSLSSGAAAMLLLKALLASLGFLLVLQTVLSFVRSRAWWVRIFDFPRPQIAIASVALLVLFGLINLLAAEEARPCE
jgi:hypothetical protein